MINNFKIGADIEVFLRNTDTGEIVSAEGFIKGTKEQPFNFDPSDKYYATSLDNVMAEFCIPPSPTPAQFYEGIAKALRYINTNIPKHLKAAALPAARLDPRYLQTENAKTFGCDPDFNAWLDVQNLPPSPGDGVTLRTAGGHIHVGYDNPNPFVNTMLVKALDLHVGVPSVILEPTNERKTMYGKAGSFRHKDYGVEWRSISNYYLQKKSLIEWVYQNTVDAINFVNNGGCNNFDEQEKEEIVSCINNNDVDLAEKLILKYGIKLAA